MCFEGSVHLKSAVNWTATYRTDSTIVTPYEKWVPYDSSVAKVDQNINFAANKTKKVAWFVSNCGARWLHSLLYRFLYSVKLPSLCIWYCQFCPTFKNLPDFNKLKWFSSHKRRLCDLLMKHYVLKYLHRYFIEAEFFLIISSLFYNYLGSYQRSGLFLRMKHMFFDNFDYISTLLSTRVRGPKLAKRKAVWFYCNLSFLHQWSGDVAVGRNVSCQDGKCNLSFRNQGGSGSRVRNITCPSISRRLW